jgi:hypothetical protein
MLPGPRHAQRGHRRAHKDRALGRVHVAVPLKDGRHRHHFRRFHRPRRLGRRLFGRQRLRGGATEGGEPFPAAGRFPPPRTRCSVASW